MSEQLSIFSPTDPESSNTEYKSASEGRLPKDIWQTISAFANTDGGTIYLGIDPEGKLVGLSRSDIDKIQQDFASLCSQDFNVSLNPIVEAANGYVVAEVGPAPAEIRPIYKKSLGMNKGAYVRVGSTNIQANEDHIRRFAIASRGGAELLAFPDTNYEECFDLKLVQEYIDLLNSKRNNMYQRFSIKEVLVKQKAITKDGNATLFGLLAFGADDSTQEIISPTINIGVTQYPGSTKVDELDPRATYTDNREFNGTVLEQFTRALAFIKTKLPIKGTIDANGIRKDYFVIPEVALREALANAIAHRDYSSLSSRVQIDIYSNRLEIINPGNSLVPLAELESAPSTTRNPILMTYLKEMGITDQKARGIRTIRITTRGAGLVEPTFENISQSFKVTLFSSAFLSPIDQVWLIGFKDFKLNERQMNALAHAHNTPDGISNSEYRDINNMRNVRDDKKANIELRTLVSLGILETTGENRARRYVLAPKFKEL